MLIFVGFWPTKIYAFPVVGGCDFLSLSGERANNNVFKKYLLGVSVVVHVFRDTILFLLSLSEHIEAYLVVSRVSEERNRSTCFIPHARWRK
jgi:hypothetical protein